MLRCKVDNGRETSFTHQPGLQPFSSLKQPRKNRIRTPGQCCFPAPPLHFAPTLALLPFLLPPTWLSGFHPEHHTWLEKEKNIHGKSDAKRWTRRNNLKKGHLPSSVWSLPVSKTHREDISLWVRGTTFPRQLVTGRRFLCLKPLLTPIPS